MHFDPMKRKLVLTEAQFMLVQKVYPSAFQNGAWCLGDDQQLTQIFLNLGHLYERLRKNKN